MAVVVKNTRQSQLPAHATKKPKQEETTRRGEAAIASRSRIGDGNVETEYDRNTLYAFTKLTIKLTCREWVVGQPLPDPLPPTSTVRKGEKQPNMVTGSSEFKLGSLIPGAALCFPACLQRAQAGKAFPKVNTDWPVASYFILPPHHHNNQYPQLESPREDGLPSPCFDGVCSWGQML